MTAATAPARAPRVPLRGPARLLRLELRRNVMPWILPLLAVMFWLTTYRSAMANPPLWNVRGSMLQAQTMLGFAPLMAGAAAWSGSREGRRGITDLVGITGLPRWGGRLAAWAAVTLWAEAAYLAGVAVVYGITARQAIWGGPLWWPVAVGAATGAAACAVGFAAGALLPSRFTVPLVAVAVFLALGGGALAFQHAPATYAQIWPLNVQGGFPTDSFGIFYPYLPDLSIVQIMFVGGLGATALGALGLPAAAGGRWLRAVAASVMIAGLAAAGTAVGLAGTAELEPHGVVIPALHDAASDRPVRYTPVCGSSAGVRVCLQPAYRPYLPEVAAALAPLLRELAGLPGAPTRVTQVAVIPLQPGQNSGLSIEDTLVSGNPVITGRPAVLNLSLAGDPLPGEGVSPAGFISQLRNTLLPLPNSFVGLPIGGLPGNRAHQAQIAVAQALAQDAGLFSQAGIPGAQGTPGSTVTGGLPQSAPAQAAARFLALPAVTRHAWLLTHLTALRAGRISLSEIP